MITFQVPTGPKNLAPLFPDVDFTKVAEYFITLVSQEDESVIMTSNTFQPGCCCNEDTMRIFFVNYVGGIDAVNFTRIEVDRDSKSSQWKKTVKYPLQKWDGGFQRFNVTDLKTVIAETRCFQEKDQEWLQELLDSPNAWVQWIGTQQQDDDYIPIVILDAKTATQKQDERYDYVTQVQFSYSNDTSILRN